MAKYLILKDGSLSVEGARIIRRNFSGKPTNVNPAGGKRTFSLVVDEETANRLVEEGWNVGFFDTEDERIYCTDVVVKFGDYPPKVFIVDEARNRMIPIDEEQISQFDQMEIRNIDLVVRPYRHGISNSKGSTIKGYLKSLFVTQDTSDFDGKYSGYSVDYSDSSHEMDVDEELPFN